MDTGEDKMFDHFTKKDLSICSIYAFIVQPSHTNG
jgi:hypothetical protein